MPLLAVLSGTGAGQKDHKTRFSSDRSLCLLMTCAAAAEFLPDKLSGIVYGMCLDTQGATPNSEKVYVAGPGARPGLVQKRGLAPNRIAIRPQEMDADEVPVPISEPCPRPRSAEAGRDACVADHVFHTVPARRRPAKEIAAIRDRKYSTFLFPEIHPGWPAASSFFHFSVHDFFPSELSLPCGGPPAADAHVRAHTYKYARDRV
jgi:hypothetical protein